MRKVLVPFLFVALGIPAMVGADTDAGHAADRTAIDTVLTYRFVAGWNDHDAHVFASAFAEDAEFTNDRGVGADGRYRIEQFHAQAFQKMFGKSHLSVEVKRIRFLKPDVADGTAAPNQTGLFALVFTTSGGPWVITVMHTIDLTPVPAAPRADR